MTNMWQELNLMNHQDPATTFEAVKYGDVFVTRPTDPIAPGGEYVFVPRTSTARNPPHIKSKPFNMDIFPRCQTDIYWVTVAANPVNAPLSRQRWTVLFVGGIPPLDDEWQVPPGSPPVKHGSRHPADVAQRYLEALRAPLGGLPQQLSLRVQEAVDYERATLVAMDARRASTSATTTPNGKYTI